MLFARSVSSPVVVVDAEGLAKPVAFPAKVSLAKSTVISILPIRTGFASTAAAVGTFWPKATMPENLPVPTVGTLPAWVAGVVAYF